MSFAYVLRTLRRRWPILLVALLIGAGSGALFARASPDSYEATTSLVVTPVVSNPITGNREEVNIRTEQEILGSREVARHAAEDLGTVEDGASTPRADVEVAAPLGSQVLQVTVRGETPQEAADGADAVATAYLELRRESASDTTERYLEAADQQIEDLRSGGPTPATDSLIESLQQQRSSVALSDPDPGRIIGAATPPTSPSGPGLLITAAGGAMAGLLLGVCIAVLRERIDRQVRSADRLELAAGALPLVTSDTGGDDFWMRLADEVIQRSRVDLEHEQVRVLLHGVPPLSSREVADKFLGAAQDVLADSGNGILWTGAGSELDEAPRTPRGAVQIVPSGTYRATLVQSARRSDVAVVIVTPHAPLKDVLEHVQTLRDAGLETVVGLLTRDTPSPSGTPVDEFVSRPVVPESPASESRAPETGRRKEVSAAHAQQ